MNRQEKLEWLARNRHEWTKDYPFLGVRVDHNGIIYSWPSDRLSASTFTHQEWLSMRDTLEKRPELSSKNNDVRNHEDVPPSKPQDNSWYDRGELPPVGCKCEILGAFGLYTEWFECEIIAAHLDSVFAANERSWINVKKGERQFRPLRTDREKAIDAAMNEIKVEDGFIYSSRSIIEKLYDAGMLK